MGLMFANGHSVFCLFFHFEIQLHDGLLRERPVLDHNFGIHYANWLDASPEWHHFIIPQNFNREDLVLGFEA